MNRIQKTPRRVTQPRPVDRSIHAGDRVECIDDQGWLIPEHRHHFTPRKGGIYVVREYTTEFGGGALSLMEGLDDEFYRAFRFRKISH